MHSLMKTDCLKQFVHRQFMQNDCAYKASLLKQLTQTIKIVFLFNFADKNLYEPRLFADNYLKPSLSGLIATAVFCLCVY